MKENHLKEWVERQARTLGITTECIAAYKARLLSNAELPIARDFCTTVVLYDLPNYPGVEEEEERQQQQLEQECEHELALQEERKKYRHKHAPIPHDVVIPTDPIIIPSQVAICKLCKGDFVELYYFTNKGLCNAELSTRSADDDALTLLQTSDGLHAFIPLATAQAKGSVTKDEDLSWEEFSEAAL
ncbi:hypothetical protein EDD15DRAFT_2528080 [Pisolithus albus]|nr:hypothetical protein EDD15DRAFT_2528080 [Pisolithus albus]